MTHQKRLAELEKERDATALPEIIIYQPGEVPVKSNAAISIHLPDNGRVSDDT